MNTLPLSSNPSSKLTLLLLAIRPKTLPASLAPVLFSGFMALDNHKFNWLVFITILTCAILIQIAVNLANDLGDFLKGADTEKRVGPPRVTQSGFVSVTTMKQLIAFTLGVALLLGVYLVSVGGMPILIIGLTSIISCLAYTAGPLPLAYVGLGDLFVLLFFGPVATGGTYYLLTSEFSIKSVIFGLGFGAISTAILVVNNLRDIEGDRLAEKYTLAVRFGKRFAKFEYVGLILFATIFVPTWIFALQPQSLKIFLSSITLLFAYPVIRTVLSSDDPEQQNQALARTGKLLLIYALLLGAGVS